MEGAAAEARADEARRKGALNTRRVLREWIVAQLDLANDPLPCAPRTGAIADCLERGVVDGQPLTGKRLKAYCKAKSVESLKLLTDLGLDDATARRIHANCRAGRRAPVASPVPKGTGQKRAPADAGLPTGNPANSPNDSASATAPMHVDAAPLSPAPVLKAARFERTLAASARPIERASARTIRACLWPRSVDRRISDCRNVSMCRRIVGRGAPLECRIAVVHLGSHHH